MKSKKETIYKRIMDSRGMKATQLAGKSGLAESTVSDILNGKRIPNYSSIQALAMGLNCSPAAFFDYKPKVPGELGLLPKSVLPLVDDLEFTRYLEAAVELYLAGVRHGQIKALVGILGHMTQK